MLVLSRKKNESIVINDDITITVVEIRAGPNGKHKVRLGIAAPREIPVDREEVHDAKMTTLAEDRLQV